MFDLHTQLEKDCVVVGDLELCRVLLANDSNYPWLILVPMRAGIREIFELSKDDQKLLQEESSAIAEAMAARFNADKMNIAALGNMVPQLHLHHIVRFQDDVAWPKPIWGVVAGNPYEIKALQFQLDVMQQLLEQCRKNIVS